MMPSFVSRLLFGVVLAICILSAQAEPIYHREGLKPRQPNDDASLAAAFHALSNKISDPEKRHENPDLGNLPQRDPRYEVIKRQQGSGIVNSSTPSVTPTPSPSPTDSESDSSSSSNSPTASETPSVTSESESPSLTSSKPTVTSVSRTSSSSKSSSVESTPSSSERATITSESASKSSSTKVGTTTDENGDPVTYTSVVVVTPGGDASSEKPTGTRTGKAGLQTGEAATIGLKKEMMAMFGGAVAVAMVL